MDTTIPKDKSSGDYRELFNNIIDAVSVLDYEGNILDVNMAMLALSGYTREELLSMNVKDVIPPGDMDRSKEFFLKLREKGSYEGYTGRIIDKYGTYKYVEITSKAFYNRAGKIIGSRDIIRDVTEKKKIEADLINSEQKFRTIVTNSEAIIFIMDKNGIFTLSEGKGLESLSLKPGEMVGSSVFELYKDSPEINEAVGLALDGFPSKIILKVGDLH